MSYFDSLLKKRGYEKCPLPLWKLKITKEEFDELRNLLEKCTHRREEMPFKGVCREATLFFAEYWRRLYNDGAHSKQMVYDALQSSGQTSCNCDKFYEAALQGAEILKIKRYKGGNSQPLNDILYQGGLPMKLITESKEKSNWGRFARDLVNKRYDIDDIGLGLVASQSDGVRGFCDQIVCSIDANDFKEMPFDCQDKNEPWFLFLQGLSKQEKKRHYQLHPFSLSWIFTIDFIEAKIYSKYIFKGKRQLSESFLKDEGLDNVSFFSIQVRKNSKVVATFDYNRDHFCRDNVISECPYANGDYISVYLHTQEQPYLGDALDMSVPHLLYRSHDDLYELGNCMGQRESLLLIPENWTLENTYNLDKQEFLWGDIKLLGILIPADFTNDLIVKGPDGKITFGNDTPLYWTQIQSHPIYEPNIIESVYDANRCNFSLCYDSEEGSKFKGGRVQFRSKWKSEWSDRPDYGKIFARVVTQDKYVTPISFINVGDKLDIRLEKADKDSCQIKITWPYGDVFTTEGKRTGDVWEIKKEDCHNPKIIRFTFTPKGNSYNQFTLSLKAPFKDFSILNIYEENIVNNCWIPYSDIDQYEYHIVGQDVIKYTYGKTKRKLLWVNDTLCVIENGHKVKDLPYEGSLVELFDSRENLRSLLERTSQNILNAEIKVRFTRSNGQEINFSIKDFPFRPKQLANGQIVITGNQRKPIKFTSTLKLIKVDDPEANPIEMSYDDQAGCYVLPDAIRSWGKTILIGREKGRVYPALVDLTTEMDHTHRMNVRNNAITSIKEELKGYTIKDAIWKRSIAWFERVQSEGMPACSILELDCIAKDHKYLFGLLCILYAKFSGEESLKERLKIFSNDLAFQWFWLRPYMDSLLSFLNSFIKDPKSETAIQMYIDWAISHGDERMELLEAIQNDNDYMKNFMKFLEEFKEWIQDLCVSSLIETYDDVYNESDKLLAESIIKSSNGLCPIDNENDNYYVETNQDDLDEQTKAFFEQYRQPGKSLNESWLYERVGAVVAHMRKKINLFTLDEKIRRSILYCSKLENHNFIIALNNELI